MKRFILNTILLAVSAAFMWSCQKEDWTYKGNQFFEFSASQNDQTSNNGVYKKENSKTGLDSVCVQLVKHSEAAVTVNYEIVKQVYYLTDESKYVDEIPAGKDLSLVDTAYTSSVYGVDYEIVTDASSTFSSSSMSGSLVIPEGSYFGYIQVKINRKAGNNFFIVLKDSKDTKANKPNAIMNFIISPDKISYFEESFLQSIPDTWTIIDKDGDGHNWNWYDGAATSDSYISGGVGAVTPENYLVSPLIEIGSRMSTVELSFELAVGDEDFPEEAYSVVVSESPITLENCRNATVVKDWTTLDASYYDFTTVKVDLSAYKGKSIYIAFIHGHCTDCYYILLKNVKVIGI